LPRLTRLPPRALRLFPCLTPFCLCTSMLDEISTFDPIIWSLSSSHPCTNVSDFQCGLV
jgi:hypothetical protein